MRSARCAVSVAAAAGLLAGALALSGCAGIRGIGAPPASGGPTTSPTSSPTSTSVPGESITGQWVLVSGEDGSHAITPIAKTVTLLIAGASSGGNGGCNAFGAVASGTTTGPFTIRVGIHTDMACVGANRNITEQQYFEALGKVEAASLSNAELILTGPGATLTFQRSGS
ncbi:MAG TPA: META domain-containing protein [Galbitalea sp.]|jgi:heat shock protein HslJ|nr:META domain-containing protein [Galbitalea sp.]